MAKFAFLAFSEVNPDNVSVYAQTHKRSAPAQPCAVSQNRPSLLKKSLSARPAVQKWSETRPKHCENVVFSPWFRG